MGKTQSVQYTVRDVPGATDLRLREAAALEEISLNQATVRAIERGLGMTGEPVRYRSLRRVLAKAGRVDRAGWAKKLGEMDRVSPDDWK
jgi:hypothetical protein